MSAVFAALGTAFALVFVAELPDKTLVATLMLTARFRPLPVFLGVTAAFAVQCTIAVAFGGLLTLLPHRAVAAIVAALFALGAFLLLREGFSREEDTVDGQDSAGQTTTPWRAALTSFGVLFAAEWGDASQLATAGLAARFGAPVWVGLGSWLALTAVAGIAVLLGKRIRERIHPKLIQKVAGLVFTVFAVLAFIEAIS